MPRPKYGLGQGLEALVSSRQRPGDWSESELLNRHADVPSSPAPESRAWEYACLGEQPGPKKRKQRLTLQLSHPEARVRPRRQTLRGVSQWTALGILGADGWELVGFRGRAFVLKRELQT